MPPSRRLLSSTKSYSEISPRTDCIAAHPDTGVVCRLKGGHRDHLGGYGPTMISWPNETWVPPPPPVTKADLKATLLTLAAHTSPERRSRR